MAKLQSVIETHHPSLCVLASQVVAATLNAAAKFIETKDEAVHPFTILYVRMLITTFGCTAYLLLSSTPSGASKAHMLFGTRDVRWLLVLRAFGGVCSATGFFCVSSFGFALIWIPVSHPAIRLNRYTNGFSYSSLHDILNSQRSYSSDFPWALRILDFDKVSLLRYSQMD